PACCVHPAETRCARGGQGRWRPARRESAGVSDWSSRRAAARSASMGRAYRCRLPCPYPECLPWLAERGSKRKAESERGRQRLHDSTHAASYHLLNKDVSTFDAPHHVAVTRVPMSSGACNSHQLRARAWSHLLMIDSLSKRCANRSAV